MAAPKDNLQVREEEDEFEWMNVMQYAGYAFVGFYVTALMNGIVRVMVGETCN